MTKHRIIRYKYSSIQIFNKLNSDKIFAMNIKRHSTNTIKLDILSDLILV